REGKGCRKRSGIKLIGKTAATLRRRTMNRENIAAILNLLRGWRKRTNKYQMTIKKERLTESWKKDNLFTARNLGVKRLFLRSVLQSPWQSRHCSVLYINWPAV